MTRVSVVFLLYSLFMNASLVFAQSIIDFNPSPVTDTIPKEVNEYLEKQLKLLKVTVNDPRNKVNEFISQIYDRQFEYILKTFDLDYFITKGVLADRIQKITTQLLASNPSIPKDVRVFQYRDDEPNAISYGNGIISIKLGLLNRLESDDQLAFIISHELSHLCLKHTNKTIVEVAQLNFDKELNKRFTQAKKSEFGSYTKLKELMTSAELSLTKNSRKHELEADSLGLIFLTRAGFHPTAALRCMEILDSADYSIKPRTIDLKKHFNNKNYPVKDNWVKYSKSTMFHKSYERPDSAKTHPSCKIRRIALKRQIIQSSSDTSFVKTNAPYSTQILSWFELAESHYHLKEYGKSLFNALLLLDEYPENPYLEAMVSKSLFQIFVYQKNHELGKVVQLPDPRFSENYDRVLSFIQNLRLTEISALNYHYITSRPVKNFSNEHVLYALWLASTLDISNLNPESIRDDYIEQYPLGRYNNAMKERPKF